jgi:Fe-S cluster assembly iron-binding protein IscA
MLQLTTDAAEYVRASREQQGLSDHAALRVDRKPDDVTALQLGFVDAPQPDDQVAETDGVQLCVASAVATDLEDKTLDIQQTDQGAAFVLRAS